MFRHAILTVAFSGLLAGSALAGEKAPAKDVGQYVDLSPVAIPIVADGKLVNYVFVSMRVMLSAGANVTKLRTREPYFRDALVRAAHRTPFTKATDYVSVDEPRIKASLYREVVALAGPGDIKSIVLSSQTPMRHVAMPGSRSGGTQSEIRP